MISKKVLSTRQKFLLGCIDAAEKVGQIVPYIMTIGITSLSLILNQKVLNSTTYENCPKELNVIVHHKTTLGNAIVCVSKMELNGPPMPIKD